MILTLLPNSKKRDDATVRSTQGGLRLLVGEFDGDVVELVVSQHPGQLALQLSPGRPSGDLVGGTYPDAEGGRAGLDDLDEVEVSGGVSEAGQRGRGAG